MIVLNIFVGLFYLYLGIGFVFGLWFVFKGVNKVDPGIEGADWKLRLLLLPGSAGLWPIMLQKFLKKRS